MIDPDTGVIYETEDNGTNSGFYNYVPFVHGSPADGGDLFMLKVVVSQASTSASRPRCRTTWDVEWVKIDDPGDHAVDVRPGLAKGGARFRRLEGAWWGNRTGYFLSTEGGITTQGQVFEYDPNEETLKLIYDSPSANDVDNPDNLTVTPRGGLLLCEDNATGPQFADGERLIGLTLDGTAFTFAVNNVNLTTAYNDRIPAGNYRQNEWAGACYSPDGQWLFANIQTPGITFAITGPWGPGPL